MARFSESKRGRSRKFRSLGNALPRVLRRLRLDAVVAQQAAIRIWPEVVGPGIALHSRAVSVRGSTLVVVVDSPVWVTQLAYLKPRLLRQLVRKSKCKTVKDMRFVLDDGAS